MQVRLIILGFLIVTVSAVGILILLLLSARKVVVADQSGPRLPDPTYSDSVMEDIKLLQDTLNRTTNEEARQHIEAKIAVFEREATARAHASDRIAARPEDPYPSAPTPAFAGVKLTGILDDVPVALSSMVFLAQNGWQEKLGDSWVRVVAGVFTKEPSQGVLIIDFYGGTTTFAKIVPMPAKDGTLKIVAADGYRLTLETEGGSTYYYDIPGLTFVDSLKEIVPTITPQPVKSSPIATITPPYP
jgi:hypothetical protein